LSIDIGGIVIEAEDPDFDLETKSSQLKCIILLPYRLPVLDKTYTIKIDSETIMVNSRKEEVQHEGNTMVGDYIFNADRYGQISKTRLEFVLSNIDCDKFTEEQQISILNKCVLAINRILEACSLISDIYCNRKIILIDIYSCYFVCNEKTILYYNPFFKETQTYFRLITTKDNYRIEKFLLTGTKVTLIEELITSADDNFLFENYRITCIEIFSATEFALSQMLEKYHIKLGTSSIQIEELLDKKVSEWSPELTKIDSTITSGRIWTDWNTKCKRVRNDVIHRHKIPTKQEAEDSINSAKELLKKLSQVQI
jgi:hypothetical protein